MADKYVAVLGSELTFENKVGADRVHHREGLRVSEIHLLALGIVLSDQYRLGAVVECHTEHILNAEVHHRHIPDSAVRDQTLPHVLDLRGLDLETRRLELLCVVVRVHKDEPSVALSKVLGEYFPEGLTQVRLCAGSDIDGDLVIVKAERAVDVAVFGVGHRFQLCYLHQHVNVEQVE